MKIQRAQHGYSKHNTVVVTLSQAECRRQRVDVDRTPTPEERKEWDDLMRRAKDRATAWDRSRIVVFACASFGGYQVAELELESPEM